MGRYLYRVFGACTLDAGMYETLEADSSATAQAALTVALASLAAGAGLSAMHGFDPARFLSSVVLALILWIAWGVLMHQIGTRAFPGPATRASLGELLRTTGFAAAPGFFQVFAVFPGATRVIFAATGAWMFVAMVVAIRHALDYDSNLRALTVAGAALLLCALFGFLLAASFSTSAS
jgi:hypothetical protein